MLIIYRHRWEKRLIVATKEFVVCSRILCLSGEGTSRAHLVTEYKVQKVFLHFNDTDTWCCESRVDAKDNSKCPQWTRSEVCLCVMFKKLRG